MWILWCPLVCFARLQISSADNQAVERFFVKINEELDNMTIMTTVQQGLGLVETSIRRGRKTLFDGGAAGVVIAQALNSETEPFSPTLELIRQNTYFLAKRFNESFNVASRLGLTLRDTEFHEQIKGAHAILINISLGLEGLIFVNESRAEGRTIIKDACQARNDQWVEHFDTIFHSNCPIPSSEDIHRYARFLKALTTFEYALSFKFSNSSTYINSRAAVMYTSLFDEGVIIEKLEKLKWHEKVDFDENGAARFLDGLIDGSSTVAHKRCVLQERFSNSSNFENLFTMVELLHLLVLQNEINDVLCWNISGPVSKKSIHHYVLYALRMQSQVAALLRHASDWVSTVQELSWPNVSVLEAQRALKLKRLFTSLETAKVVKEVFEKLRRPNDGFQVLTVCSLFYDEIRFRSLDPSTATDFHDGPWKIYVFRYTLPIHERTRNSSDWFHSTKSDIEEALASANATTPVDEVLNYLQSDVDLLDLNRFRSAVLLQNLNFTFFRTYPKLIADQAFSLSEHFEYLNRTTGIQWYLALFT